MGAATTKHFIAYQGASSRGTFSPTEVFLSWRDQIDTYEVAWRVLRPRRGRMPRAAASSAECYVVWQAVLEVGSAAVMCAYSSLCHDDTNTTCSLPPPDGYGRSHGVPMCADGEMLNGFLRTEMGWDGMVTGEARRCR